MKGFGLRLYFPLKESHTLFQISFFVFMAFFQVGFRFSINSLILPSFPLTFFHLAEASLSAFSWLYTLVFLVVQKYHEMFFIYNYSNF